MGEAPLDDHQRARSPNALEGTRLLERYQVHECLGEGGMAVVYRGAHATIGKKVALKVLRSEFVSHHDATARFLQEARAASRIQHPNVVEISDFGETDDGLVFCVMEYLEGEDLGTTLEREGALEWPRACRIVLQICDALSAAHAAGVVHRDLKPDNCFRLTRERESDFIKVLDFGIAHVMRGPEEMQEGRPRTAIGFVAGTPAYMSPEQARGRRVDARTDIYAVGVMLFELISGQLPFIADSSTETLALQLHAPIPSVRELAPDVPVELEEVIFRALQKDAAGRFADMKEVGAAIEEIYADNCTEGVGAVMPVDGAGSATIPPAPSPTERRVPLVPVVAGALALGVGAGWWLLKQRSTAAAAGRPSVSVANPDPEQSAPPEEPSSIVLASSTTHDSTTASTEELDSDTSGGDGLPESVTVELATNVVASILGPDGTELGTTDAPVSWPRSEDRLEIVLRRPGYEQLEISVVPNEDKRIEVTLKKRARRTPPSRRGATSTTADEPPPEAPLSSKISEVKNPFE